MALLAGIDHAVATRKQALVTSVQVLLHDSDPALKPWPMLLHVQPPSAAWSHCPAPSMTPLLQSEQPEVSNAQPGAHCSVRPSYPEVWQV